jgi:hypothetical protein
MSREKSPREGLARLQFGAKWKIIFVLTLVATLAAVLKLGLSGFLVALLVFPLLSFVFWAVGRMNIWYAERMRERDGY